MNILVVTPFYKPAYRYGGPTRSLPTLCEALVKLGCNVTVYTTNANGETKLSVAPNQMINVDGVSVTYFERNIKNGFFYSRKLAQACYRNMNHFDCLYVNSNWGYPFIPACYAAIEHNIPYIITARNSFNKRAWKGKFFKKMLYHQIVEHRLINRASLLHYTTELEMEESRWLGLKPEYCIVPNPVNLTEFDNMPIRGLWRETQGIPQDTLIILYLGRIEARKGLDITLKSFVEVSKARQDVLLVLAGPDEDGYIATLQALSNQYGITERVRFVGYLDANTRLQALADTDVFVLTSYYENFGMAVVEAMAAGLPVLVSDKVGIARDIEDSQAGLVTPLDADSVAHALERLLQSRQERENLGKQAIFMAHERFSPERVAQVMLDHIARIVE